MRSKLFVPGSRPEWFAKALASDADAISIDLEDSVVEARKAEARASVSEFLKSAEALRSGKTFVVRVNAPGTSHFEADVLAITQPALAMLNLPKAESAEDIHGAVAVIERAEAANGVRKATYILANIETPKGLRYAADIASAHPRVAGLQLGYFDLFAPFGIDRRDSANVHAAMFAMRIAASEANRFAYDGAFPDLKDAAGFREEAERARRLGYAGKSCIHPSQVALANEVFTPSEADVELARRVLEAHREAEARGVGAFLVDGRMIDAPAIRRAEAILAASQHTNRGSPT